MEGVSSFDYYENCYLLTGDDVEPDGELEVELTGELFFNTEFRGLNREVVATVNNIDELIEFCNKHDISIPDACCSREGYLYVGGDREYVIDAELGALGWKDELLASVNDKIAEAQDRAGDTKNASTCKDSYALE